ncbi:MAG TPA: hypothetical protein PLA87_19340 [Pseudomonadota bacterium]|jgi:hypothetical protein|nr:hypothetical protein [Pseudomonadota bacterium]
MFGGNSSEWIANILEKVKTEIPAAVYRHAKEMNLADTALKSVLEHAVRSAAGPSLASNPLAQKAASLLGGVSSLFGAAESLGINEMIQKALDSTDIDEQLRDALTQGFTRYLQDNAAHLAKLALQTLTESLKPKT